LQKFRELNSRLNFCQFSDTANGIGPSSRSSGERNGPGEDRWSSINQIAYCAYFRPIRPPEALRNHKATGSTNVDFAAICDVARR
jgi:hypothetical protein